MYPTNQQITCRLHDLPLSVQSERSKRVQQTQVVVRAKRAQLLVLFIIHNHTCTHAATCTCTRTCIHTHVHTNIQSPPPPHTHTCTGTTTHTIQLQLFSQLHRQRYDCSTGLWCLLHFPLFRRSFSPPRKYILYETLRRTILFSSKFCTASIHARTSPTCTQPAVNLPQCYNVSYSIWRALAYRKGIEWLCMHTLHCPTPTLPCSHQTTVGGTGMDGVLGYSKQLGEEGKERALLGGMVRGSGRSPLHNEQAAMALPEKRARARL